MNQELISGTGGCQVYSKLDMNGEVIHRKSDPVVVEVKAGTNSREV